MFLNLNLEQAGGAVAVGCFHCGSYLSPCLPYRNAVGSFACECPTEPIKSSLFYGRGLIELARLPSLGSFSVLKIT